MNTSVLQKIGLTDNEIKIYLALLEEGSSRAGIITEKTGIHRRNVYDAIDRLIEKGLVGYIVKKRRKYFEAVDPKYFNRIFQEKKQEIKKQEQNFSNILPFLNELYNTSKEKQEITFYRGREAIKLLLTNVLDTKSVNHVIGAQPLNGQFKSIINQYHDRRIKEKIHEKIIFDKKAEKRALNVSKMPYVDVRFFPIEYSNELTLNIYGNRVALLLYSQTEPISIMIKNKEIYEGFMKYFEMIWSISVRL